MAEHPDITIEVAFSTDPLTRPGAMDWTELSAAADNPPTETLKTSRGYDVRANAIEAGVCSMVLDNTNRELDPSNTASTYYPNVKPRKRIRVRFDPPEGGEAVRDVWTGFVERWPIEWRHEDAWVAVTATDILSLIAEETLPSSALEVEMTRLANGADDPSAYVDHYWPLGDEFGTSTPDLVGSADGRYLSLVSGGARSAVPYDSLPGQVFSYLSAGGSSTPQEVTMSPSTWNPLFTFDLWYRLDDRGDDTGPGDGARYRLFRSVDESSNKYAELWLWDDGPTLRVIVTDGTNTSTFDYSAANLLDGSGHHIIVTYSLTHGTDDYPYLYIDGVFVGWNDSPTINNPTLTGWDTARITIGQSRPAVNPSTVTGAWSHVIGHVSTNGAVATEAAATLAPYLARYTAGVEAWDGDTTSERLERILDILGIDGDDRDISTGAEVCGPTVLGNANALDYLRKIAATEDGPLFVSGDGKITFPGQLANDPTISEVFDDQGVDVPYESVDLNFSLDRVINTASVQREGGVTQTETDTASQDDYGVLDGGLGVVETLHRSSATTRGMAARLVVRNSEPKMIIERLSLWSRDDDVPVLAVLDLDVGDAVTVSALPPGGGSAISQDCYIERVEHEVRSDQTWTTTYGLAEFVVLPAFAWDTTDQGWNEAVWS